MISMRQYYSIIFIGCTSLLCFGLYLEHIKGLEPCPLCIFQRIAFITIAFIAFVAAIHNPKRFFVRAYNILLIIVSTGGAGIAGRQIWLQHLPTDQVPECGAGLEYMLEAFPLAEALQMILSGSGECAEVQWQFIGLSIAEWSFICFTVLMISHIIAIFSLNNSKL